MHTNFDKIYKGIERIREHYLNGGNIISFITKEILNEEKNSIETILTSYDFQSGSYVKFCNQNFDYVKVYTKHIANLLETLDCKRSVLEVGCGEATTLTNVLNNMSKAPRQVLGFDISLSRISVAKKYYQQHINNKSEKSSFFCADLFEIPLPDSSVEVVYTSHSLEPNGGREVEAIAELFRVASSYVVLLEPSYENNSDEGKQRMNNHGYVKNLKGAIEKLGLNLQQCFEFPVCFNKLNPTWAYIIKKDSILVEPHFKCLYTEKELVDKGDSLIAEGYLAYPKILGTPYLIKSHAILATNVE